MGINLPFFKQRKPRSFQLKPRYYDEHKERLAESEERVRKELGINQEEKEDQRGYEQRIRGKFMQSIEGAKERKNEKVRLSIVIAIIFFVGYMLYNNYVG
jgi:hypothetical protein